MSPCLCLINRVGLEHNTADIPALLPKGVIEQPHAIQWITFLQAEGRIFPKISASHRDLLSHVGSRFTVLATLLLFFERASYYSTGDATRSDLFDSRLDTGVYCGKTLCNKLLWLIYNLRRDASTIRNEAWSL